ncbi:hypothetical protein ACFOEE_19200 [Pseudoalteromonas fenneropenaei]|uniref:PH domain-containing protein n=1 Tax=Pseudoalteromonas fenneropenaei TaxID=1737459 RepID=A0ABV7CPM0_9GAMM
MRELKLQINTAFYLFLFLSAALVWGLGLVFNTMHIDFAYSIQMVISVLIVCFCIFNLSLSIAGQCKAVFCKQGLYYVNIFGRRRYIVAEQIVSLQVRSICGIKVTRIKMTESTLILFAFKPNHSQQEQLREFGYPI